VPRHGLAFPTFSLPSPAIVCFCPTCFLCASCLFRLWPDILCLYSNCFAIMLALCFVSFCSNFVWCSRFPLCYCMRLWLDALILSLLFPYVLAAGMVFWGCLGYGAICFSPISFYSPAGFSSAPFHFPIAALFLQVWFDALFCVAISLCFCGCD